MPVLSKNKIINNRPIGIFDSGIGGLTVFKQIRSLLPQEDLIYFGDTARVPYGSKSKDTIIKFSIDNVLFLLNQRVKLIVIACNTSSALALDYIKSIFNIPLIGVISPGVEKALKSTLRKSIAVIGTKATIESNAYQQSLLEKNNRLKIFSQPCPLFVPLVEEGLLEGEIVQKIINLYLGKFRGKIDTLILGCTHYPLLKKSISLMLPQVELIDSSYEVARKVKDFIEKNNLSNTKKNIGKEKFFVTDEPNNFQAKAKIFLNRPIPRPQLVIW